MRSLLGPLWVRLPLSLVFFLIGGFVALNGIGDHRTGKAAEARTMCADSESDVCFDVVEATISPQIRGRRDIGREWDATGVDGDELKGFSVTHDDSDLLEEVGDEPVDVWVKPSDPTDPSAIALPDGTLVQSQWNGLRGVAAHLVFGLLIIGIGFGLLLRAGSVWPSLLIVPAALGVLGVFIEVPPFVALAFGILATVGGIVAVVATVLLRRG